MCTVAASRGVSTTDLTCTEYIHTYIHTCVHTRRVNVSGEMRCYNIRQYLYVPDGSDRGTKQSTRGMVHRINLQPIQTSRICVFQVWYVQIIHICGSRNQTRPYKYTGRYVQGRSRKKNNSRRSSDQLTTDTPVQRSIHQSDLHTPYTT